MRRLLSQIWSFFDQRLGVSASLGPMLRHPTPRGARWWYVFGSASLTLFLIQVVTGICLGLVYTPAAAEAYKTLVYLNDQQPLGWFLRALHNTAASGMVVMVVVHMTQVFLFGSFKYPRQLTWLCGVALLFLTLGMAFSGQVLRWDQDAYWGVGVGASMAGRIPVLGPLLVRGLLGGPTIGAETLTRFFGLHVFVLPATLAAVAAVHLYLVLRLGISEPPKPGVVVDPATYDEHYQRVLESGEPFYPGPLLRDAIFSSLTVIAVVVIAVLMGPKGPGEPADPTIISAEPRPDWYFLPLFALLALSPPKLEVVVIFALPLLAVLVLLLVPFIAGRGERHYSRRPVAVLSVVVIALSVGVLGWLGNKSPWSPDMFAWSGAPVAPQIVKRLTPLELQGAAVFQLKTCRNCHALEGIGGKRGPDLTYVGATLTRDELIRQVIQGGGLMPAYGNQLKPAEVEALVAFLHSLRPAGEPPAVRPVQAGSP